MHIRWRLPACILAPPGNLPAGAGRAQPATSMPFRRSKRIQATTPVLAAVVLFVADVSHQRLLQLVGFGAARQVPGRDGLLIRLRDGFDGSLLLLQVRFWHIGGGRRAELAMTRAGCWQLLLPTVRFGNRRAAGNLIRHRRHGDVQLARAAAPQDLLHLTMPRAGSHRYFVSRHAGPPNSNVLERQAVPSKAQSTELLHRLLRLLLLPKGPRDRVFISSHRKRTIPAIGGPALRCLARVVVRWALVQRALTPAPPLVPVQSQSSHRPRNLTPRKPPLRQPLEPPAQNRAHRHERQSPEGLGRARGHGLSIRRQTIHFTHQQRFFAAASKSSTLICSSLRAPLKVCSSI